MVPALDISQFQGNWVDRGDPIVMVKMSGGDAGLYMDAKASENYDGAVRAGRAVGGYHFIGWTLGAIAEATYFLAAMSPIAENDVYALDIEAIPVGVNPVIYVTDMVNHIHSKINVFPLLYMNLSTLMAHDWSTLLKDCGLWLADWDGDPNANIPNVPVYVMQQYSDGPVYDHDEWFGTVDEFKKYGYHAVREVTNVPTQTNPVAPTETPAPNQPTATPSVPAPQPDPQTPAPVVTPEAPAGQVTPPAQPEAPKTQSFFALVLALIKRLLGIK